MTRTPGCERRVVGWTGLDWLSRGAGFASVAPEGHVYKQLYYKLKHYCKLNTYALHSKLKSQAPHGSGVNLLMSVVHTNARSDVITTSSDNWLEVLMKRPKLISSSFRFHINPVVVTRAGPVSGTRWEGR